jgi:pimeloyl-ACP methyl ester carboxylesterase
MTIVLVHGNPETEAIWDDLVPHLREDNVVRLSPPGFGSAIPPDFDCSVIAIGLPANSRSWRNRSISWGMTGAGDMSRASQWIFQI